MNTTSTGNRESGRRATECRSERLPLQGHKSRRVDAAFDGGHISSDGGLLFVRELLERLPLLDRLAECFTDHRDPTRVEHSVRELLAQRVLGIILGYEDLNDHDRLRSDPMLALAVGKADVTGAARPRARDRQAPLASRSTLNRLELAGPNIAEGERYKKICFDEVAVQRLLVEHFIDAHPEAPEALILDIDATDDRVHGNQEGRHFHGHYGEYIYMPLYIFADGFLLSATLNTAERAPGSLALEDLERVVAELRARWPDVEITIRGDSGFCRDEIMKMCEDNEGLHYVLGLAQNSRLREEVADAMAEARVMLEETGESARVFHEFSYKTRDTWSRERRVIGKAEALVGRDNPRFVVTSLPAERHDAQALYEELYCARGEMENRIKEQQLGLFADRTSAQTLRANQLRLWLSSVAYVLLHELRRLALPGTELEKAQVSTIRTRLLKIGALVKVSVRRVAVSLSSAFPLQRLLRRAVERLHAALPLPAS